jgi:uncharacterized membrane protein (DUF485 family)
MAWDDISATPEYRELVRAKRRFIVPATLFFLVYYFALPVLVGYAPGLMQRRVFGAVNVAYLFALSQFLMAWALAALYVRAASRWDVMAREIVRRAEELPQARADRLEAEAE